MRPLFSTRPGEPPLTLSLFMVTVKAPRRPDEGPSPFRYRSLCGHVSARTWTAAVAHALGNGCAWGCGWPLMPGPLLAGPFGAALLLAAPLMAGWHNGQPPRSAFVCRLDLPPPPTPQPDGLVKVIPRPSRDHVPADQLMSGPARVRQATSCPGQLVFGPSRSYLTVSSTQLRPRQ